MNSVHVVSHSFGEQMNLNQEDERVTRLVNFAPTELFVVFVS